jgi:heme a synthase
MRREGLSKKTFSRCGALHTPINRRRFLQAVAILGAISAYATIVLGGTVRGTGAGLACPDWPLCHGSIVPNLADPLVAIEYAHRLAAAVTSLCLLLTFVVAVLWFRVHRGLVILSFTALAILGTQVVIGGLTISSSLDWVIVTVHLALGTATFAASLAVALLSFVRLPPTVPGGAAPD